MGVEGVGRGKGEHQGACHVGCCGTNPMLLNPNCQQVKESCRALLEHHAGWRQACNPVTRVSPLTPRHPTHPGDQGLVPAGCVVDVAAGVGKVGGQVHEQPGGADASQGQGGQAVHQVLGGAGGLTGAGMNGRGRVRKGQGGSRDGRHCINSRSWIEHQAGVLSSSSGATHHTPLPTCPRNTHDTLLFCPKDRPPPPPPPTPPPHLPQAGGQGGQVGGVKGLAVAGLGHLQHSCWVGKREEEGERRTAGQTGISGQVEAGLQQQNVQQTGSCDYLLLSP